MSNIVNRNKEIIRMKEDKVSQQEIAKKFGITRQRVQQIESSLGLNRKKDLVIFKHKCPVCSKEFEDRNEERKYCSRGCSSSGRRIVRNPEETTKYNEELREKRRIRAYNYYHKK